MQLINRKDISSISDKKIFEYFLNANILSKELTDIFSNVKEWNIENLKNISKYTLKYLDSLFKVYNRFYTMKQNNEINLDNFYIANKKIKLKKYKNIQSLLKENNINIDYDFFKTFKSKKEDTFDYFFYVDEDIKKLVFENKIIPVLTFFNKLLKIYNENILINMQIPEYKKEFSKKSRSTPFEYSISVSTVLDKEKIYQIHRKHNEKDIKEIQNLLKKNNFIKVLEIDQDTDLSRLKLTLKEINKLNIAAKDVIFKIRKLGNYGKALGIADKEQNLLVIEDTTAIIHELGHLIDFILMKNEKYKKIRKQIIQHFKEKINTKKLLEEEYDLSYFLDSYEIIARLAEIYYYYKIQKNSYLTKDFDKFNIKNLDKILKKDKIKNNIKEILNNIYFNFDNFNEEDWKLLENYFSLFFVDKKLELSDVNKLIQDKKLKNFLKNNTNKETPSKEYVTGKKIGRNSIIKQYMEAKGYNKYILNDKFYKNLRKLHRETLYHIYKDNFLKGKPENLLEKYDDQDTVLYGFYLYIISIYDDTKELNKVLKDDNVYQTFAKLTKLYYKDSHKLLDIDNNMKIKDYMKFIKKYEIKDKNKALNNPYGFPDIKSNKNLLVHFLLFQPGLKIQYEKYLTEKIVEVLKNDINNNNEVLEIK